MRSITPRRGIKINQAANAGQVIVYLCAIALGVAVAYAFLSAGPFKVTHPIDVDEPYETTRLAASRAHRVSSSSGTWQQHDSSKQQDRQQGSKAAGSEVDSEEDAWYKKLDVEGCRATEDLRVCSHRAKSLEIADVYPGSLTAYQALWNAKIRCFDIDFVTTSDGHLLASHPDDLQHVLDVKKYGRLRDTVSQHTLAAIREGGADEERFPLMEHVLQLLAKMIDSEEDKWWIKEGTPVDYGRLPGIYMDLKGPAFSRESVKKIGEVAAELQITPHVAVFVMSDEQQSAAQKAGYSGPLIRGYLDQVDPNPALTAEALAPYAMLGPSIHMADAFFKEVLRLEKAAHAWTVDTPPALHRALEVGVDSVISNTPLALRSVLYDWRDRCSDHLE